VNGLVCWGVGAIAVVMFGVDVRLMCDGSDQ
jgi:hypothetical protein